MARTFGSASAMTSASVTGGLPNPASASANCRAISSFR